MIKHRIKKSLGVLSGMCLVLLTVISCTNDYFLEETTFRLYVPQLEKTSTDKLSDLHVFFHNAKESHVITRKVDSTTLRDEMLDKGILRFKIPPESNHTVTCIANTENYIVGGGNKLRDAYVSAEPWERTRAAGTAYKVNENTGIRILGYNPVTVYPINHPDGIEPFKADINDSTVYSARISLEFISLPSNVSRVEVEYYGLATHYSLYSGSFTRLATTDYYLSKTAVTQMGTGTTKMFTRSMFPSDGASVRTAGEEKPINMIVRFYDAIDNVIFAHNLDEHGYPAYTIGGVTYPKWDPSMSAVKPQVKIKNKDHITLTFKGWTVFGLTLRGWGEIIDGEPTPM